MSKQYPVSKWLKLKQLFSVKINCNYIISEVINLVYKRQNYGLLHKQIQNYRLLHKQIQNCRLLYKMEPAKLVFIICIFISSSDSSILDYQNDLTHDLTKLIETVTGTMAEMQRQLSNLAEHQMMQDLYTSERLRSEGHSGIKLVRMYRGGTRPYHLSSHASSRMAGMHNHADFRTVIG